MNMKNLLVICVCFFALSANAQVQKVAPPSYFGFHMRTIFPSQFVGTNTLNLEENGFLSTVSQRIGYSFGGNVRVGVTDLIAIESGINFTQRYYDINYAVPDSNIAGTGGFGFIEYDIPLNALFYIKLSDRWYANASMGFAITFKPTNVQTMEQPFGFHRFIYTGLLRSKFGFDAMANFGFEYRTDKHGIFYLGGSARVPFSPLFDLVASYEWQGITNRTFGEMDGSFLSIDLKYFFPNIRNRGPQFKEGPIE
jgi:hypothetical protein